MFLTLHVHSFDFPVWFLHTLYFIFVSDCVEGELCWAFQVLESCSKGKLIILALKSPHNVVCSDRVLSWFLWNHAMTFRDLWSRKELLIEQEHFCEVRTISATMRSQSCRKIIHCLVLCLCGRLSLINNNFRATRFDFCSSINSKVELRSCCGSVSFAVRCWKDSAMVHVFTFSPPTRMSQRWTDTDIVFHSFGCRSSRLWFVRSGTRRILGNAVCIADSPCPGSSCSACKTNMGQTKGLCKHDTSRLRFVALFSCIQSNFFVRALNDWVGSKNRQCWRGEFS